MRDFVSLEWIFPFFLKFYYDNPTVIIVRFKKKRENSLGGSKQFVFKKPYSGMLAESLLGFNGAFPGMNVEAAGVRAGKFH